MFWRNGLTVSESSVPISFCLRLTTVRKTRPTKLPQNSRPFWRTKSFAVMVRKGGAIDHAQPLAQD